MRNCYRSCVMQYTCRRYSAIASL